MKFKYFLKLMKDEKVVLDKKDMQFSFAKIEDAYVFLIALLQKRTIDSELVVSKKELKFFKELDDYRIKSANQIYKFMTIASKIFDDILFERDVPEFEGFIGMSFLLEEKLKNINSILDKAKS